MCYGLGVTDQEVDMRVWKYPLQPGLNEVSMVKGARVLSVIEQHGLPALYAANDVPADADDVALANLDTEVRLFFAAMTGQSVPIGPQDSDFLGTVRSPRDFVLHIFEVNTAAALADGLFEKVAPEPEA